MFRTIALERGRRARNSSQARLRPRSLSPWPRSKYVLAGATGAASTWVILWRRYGAHTCTHLSHLTHTHLCVPSCVPPCAVTSPRGITPSKSSWEDGYPGVTSVAWVHALVAYANAGARVRRRAASECGSRAREGCARGYLHPRSNPSSLTQHGTRDSSLSIGHSVPPHSKELGPDRILMVDANMSW